MTYVIPNIYDLRQLKWQGTVMEFSMDCKNYDVVKRHTLINDRKFLLNLEIGLTIHNKGIQYTWNSQSKKVRHI